ncbi:MAG TPA: aminoglycoside phosphotransferase family protein [Pyrinomonadaceae bacterium]|jgi:aminoglycoside phosphotransferase (APT) family kinase protein|nr:aminoglycoside phosphotransferase family protein [Pyrinomonadaceae bacterium]
MPPASRNHFSPSADALRWVADAVGSGARVTSVSPLAGASSTLLHSIEADYKGRIIKLVLRQFDDEKWVEREPDLARHEAANIEMAGAADVPTPELIAYDEHGDYCGVPSTLVTLLPGRVELKPSNFDEWLSGLARALLPVHALDADGYPWSYYPYSDLARLEPPAWSSWPELWEKAIEIVRGAPPVSRVCFIHRDYHPNNVLWKAGRVSGIVDWVNACRGPAGIDVAWCRQNLAQLYGVSEADAFLDAYRLLADGSFEYHPYWDLIAAIEFLPGPPGVYEGWLAFGAEGLSDELTTGRVDEYLSSVLARV